MVICPTCNAQNDPSAGFCDQCGTSLKGAASVAAPASFAPPPAPSFGGGGSVCPQCGIQVIAGEMFCENCGAALNSVPPAAAPAATPASYAPPVVPPPPAFVAPAPAVVVYLTGFDGQTHQLSGKTNYLIGRKDDVSGNYPDVDTGDAGLQTGVSRRHAELYQQGAQWFVHDLTSVNGTWVNMQRVSPNGTMPINSGDTLKLGKWVGTFRV
jgi:hypothetical protein